MTFVTWPPTRQPPWIEGYVWSSTPWPRARPGPCGIDAVVATRLAHRACAVRGLCGSRLESFAFVRLAWLHAAPGIGADDQQ